MLRVLVLSVLVVAALGHLPRPKPPQPGCNYYCTKPEGPNKGAKYCCGPEFLPLIREEKHNGFCPPPLKDCTRILPPQLRIVVVTLLVVAVTGQIDRTPPPRPDGCNYYCIKPAGPNRGAAYCCGPANLPVRPEQRHPGRCPPPLSVCTSFAFAIPQVCPHDGHCPRNQKCCFDTCLDLHTCKPAQ